MPSCRPADAGKNWSGSTPFTRALAGVGAVNSLVPGREKLARARLTSVGDTIRLHSAVANWVCEKSCSGQFPEIAPPANPPPPYGSRNSDLSEIYRPKKESLLEML